MGHVKNELIDYFEEEGKMEVEHHHHEAVDPLAALRKDAALAELIQHLFNHNVKTIAELIKMKPEDLKDLASNFLIAKSFYPDIVYHHLSAEQLNQIFAIAE